MYNNDCDNDEKHTVVAVVAIVDQSDFVDVGE